MSLSAFALAAPAIADTRLQAVKPTRAPSKRTIVAQRDVTGAPEAR